jgi:hypothetical protein
LREGGRASTGRLKLPQHSSSVREGGSVEVLRGWQKCSPKVRWVIEGGRFLRGWLKFFPNVTAIIELGRPVTKSSKSSANVMWMAWGGMELSE